MCKSKWLYVFVDMDQHHDNTIVKRHSATRHDDFICSTPGSSLLAAFRWRLVPLVEFWIFQELYGYITVIHCPRLILNTLYSMDFVCTQADSMGGRSISGLRRHCLPQGITLDWKAALKPPGISCSLDRMVNHFKIMWRCLDHFGIMGELSILLCFVCLI